MTIPYSQSQWKEMQAILDAVLDQAPDKQLVYLKQVCGQRLELLNEIKQLLLAEKEMDSFLEQGAMNLLRSESRSTSHCDTPMRILSGQRIAHWRLCEELGRGGMGVVYRAQRDDGAFDQNVAIKILTTNHQQSFNHERFRQEQQLLAMLVHPGIAQLYDGGLTDDGLAYFVMEYVPGLPLNKYCEQHELSIKAILQLMTDVAHALAYAHKHLIVHRDIKPSNILVTCTGQIKLLDFGIAKLLDGQHASELTRTGEQVMTPGFAAPEQLQNKGVTVATDVYQLGLVLYELLTGVKPYQHQVSSFKDLVQLICEGDLLAPSQLVSQSKFNLPTRNRAGEWQKQLRGEIDALVLKMLNRNPEERYGSMFEFVSDVNAYFSSRPLIAQKNNFFLNAKKFIKRNWRSISISLLAVLFVMIYVITITLQANKIELALARSLVEQNKSQQVSDMLVNVFKAADPNVSGLDTLTARELLDKSHARILTELGDAPGIQSHMLTLVGEIYFSQGSYDKSIKILEDSYLLQRAAGRADTVGYANTLTQLGMAYIFLGRNDEAFSLLQESLNIHAALKNNQQHAPLEHAETLAAFGQLQDEQGNYSDAQKNLRAAIKMLRPLEKQGYEKLATALNNLAVIQHTKGQFEQAVVNMREAIQLQRSVLGENHSYYTVHLVNYAIMLTDMELFSEAESVLREALSIQKNLLGEAHAYYFTSLHSLGVLFYKQGQLLAAERYLQESLKLKLEMLSESSKSIAVSYLWLGATLRDLGRLDEAGAAFDKMLIIFEMQNNNSELVGRGLSEMAALAWSKGNLDQAEEYYKKAISLMLPQGIRITISQMGYGHLLLSQGHATEALPFLQRAYEKRNERYPPDHSMVAEAKVLLGRALLQTGSAENGKNFIRAGFDALENSSYFHNTSLPVSCCRSSILDPSLGPDM